MGGSTFGGTWLTCVRARAGYREEEVVRQVWSIARLNNSAEDELWGRQRLLTSCWFAPAPILRWILVGGDAREARITLPRRLLVGACSRVTPVMLAVHE